jgi:transposase
MFKSLLLNSLNPVPSGLQKAGVRTLHKIGESLADSVLVKAYKAWAAEDKEIGDLTTEFSSRIASRLSNGYSRVAHDICRLLSEHGVSTIAIQNSLLAKVAKKKKSSDTDVEKAILENSQTNRQRIAPGLLMMKLSSVAEVYGLNVIKVENAYISRAHYNRDPECNHVNPQSVRRLITCEKCGKVYDQDENACRNMVAIAVAHSPNGSAK